MACRSANTCEAVGGGAVVPITNGTTGTPQVVPGNLGLRGVACPKATTCEAVGATISYDFVSNNYVFEGVAVSVTNAP